MDSVVYIVQEPPMIYDRASKRHFSKDLSSAQRYGRIVYILGPSDQASLTPGPCMHKLRKELKDFRPDADYICFAGGDPMSLALAMLVLRDMNINTATALRWDRERDTSGERKNGGFYVPVSTPLRPY